jgi:hypothetical protein
MKKARSNNENTIMNSVTMFPDMSCFTEILPYKIFLERSKYEVTFIVGQNGFNGCM